MRAVTGRFRRSVQSVQAIAVAALFLVGAVACSDDSMTIDDPPVDMRGGDFDPAWSPGGRSVAYVAEELDSIGIMPFYSDYLRVIDVESRELTVNRRLNNVLPEQISWSPDGRWLVFRQNRGIFKMLASGDSMTQLTAGEFHVSPSWSRVSDRIFFAINGGTEGGVLSLRPDGTDLRRWSDPDISLTTPSCFADTDSLVVAQFRKKDHCVGVFVPGDTFLTIPLACGLSYVDQVRISGDRRYVVYRASTAQVTKVWIFVLDRAGGTARPLVDGGAFDLADDGKRIVYSDYRHTRGLRILDIQSSEVTQLTDPRP